MGWPLPPRSGSHQVPGDSQLCPSVWCLWLTSRSRPAPHWGNALEGGYRSGTFFLLSNIVSDGTSNHNDANNANINVLSTYYV